MQPETDIKVDTEQILIPPVPQALNLLEGEMAYIQSGVYGSGYGLLTFEISSNDPTVIMVPSTITIDTGTDPYSYPYTFTFPVSAVGIGEAVITVTLNGRNQAAEVQVCDKNSVPILSLIWITLPVTTGPGASCWVNLDRPASQDSVIRLTSSDASIASVPESVTIEAGATQSLFTLEPQQIGTVKITAALDNQSIESAVEVIGPALSIANVSPTYLHLQVGQSAPVTITLTEPAPADVELTIIPGGLPGMELPKQVLIRKGQQRATFEVKAVSSEMGGGFTIQYSRIGFVVFVNIEAEGE